MRRLFALTLVASLAASGSLAPPPAHAVAAAKIYVLAKDAFARKEYKRAARLCWAYLRRSKPAAEKYEAAQFYLAQSLQKLGFYHGAVEYYFQVASNRRTPELLPRAVRELEKIALERPIDRGLILRDLIGDTDFGQLSGDLADFVHYWQGVTNMRRGLQEWASERLEKIRRRGYYFFASLYAGSVRLLRSGTPKALAESVRSFAELFGPLDLTSALEALRRRGESDSKLAYSIKALLNEDNEVSLRYNRLPKGWGMELAMLGLSRVAAETGALLKRAKQTDDEELGKPFAYSVSIGGLPIYRRAPRFEARAPAIKAVAKRYNAVRKLRGLAMHSLARLLYEQKRYAAAYDTLGKVPRHTELGSEILLERAWSKYKAGDPHRAMGLLYALDAPVYRGLFAPEKFILRGLIYRRFCHFRAAKIAARGFRREYEKTLLMIRGGRGLERIKAVRYAALRRVPTRPLYLFYRTIRNEQKALGEMDYWKKGGLLANLRKLYGRKRQQIRAELRRSLAKTSAEIGEEMLTAEEQVNLLEYEVGQAIFQRVGESSDAKVRKPAAKVPIASERVYYRFNGEYWTDELPRYKFNIEDRCVE
ncbi:MAG: hypothetical protein KC503_09775 [Myxococcales bacterium]|nr:hypothetical protein [Myxococcales bacterium]